MGQRILTVLGVAMALMGTLWVLQGLGEVRWPASSFMIDDRQWVTYGGLLAGVGIVLIMLGRRGR